ncbi:MAG: RluA family pseudouridine synthase [Mycoplasmoidaceae bacterium]
MEIIKVQENDTNIRLDNFLMKLFPNLSKGYIFKAIRTNKVKVNGKKPKFGYRLQLNDEIKLFINENVGNNQADNWQLAKDILDVVYEDVNLLVVNKPAKLLVNDEKEEIADTLINRAKKYLFKKNKWDPEKENQFAPCLVHRIDFNTTGLVMIAKTHEASVILSQKIKDREIDKFYQCLVYGKMPQQSQLLEAYWTKPKNGNLVKISNTSSIDAKHIITKYKVLKYDQKQDVSLLEVELLTGRTHQIRAHLAFIGHPLVGEQKYISREIKKKTNFKSQALVAYKLKFNFKTDAGKLAYLDKQVIELKNIRLI